MSYWTTIPLLLACLPYLFRTFQRSSWDRWIGDLSYPLYISHLFVKWVLVAIFSILHISAPPSGLLLLLCSTLFSVFMVLLMERPIDQFRQSRVPHLAAPIKGNLRPAEDSSGTQRLSVRPNKKG
jgi:peptidoglycan/LPS O-acetylase OafA/YrhL